MTFRYTFPPIAAFLGGVVSQEIVKAITQKFTPINQIFYYDCAELFQCTNIFELVNEPKEAWEDELDGSVLAKYNPSKT